MKARNAAFLAGMFFLALGGPLAAHPSVGHYGYPLDLGGSLTIWGGSYGPPGWSGSLSFGSPYYYAPGYIPWAAVPPGHRHVAQCNHGPRHAYAAAYRQFPWHPHRGIETVTYVLAGEVEHGDSLGKRGVIAGGDVQWMTAGRGIIHQKMPQGDRDGKMHGSQLWANLPSSLKMTAPRYQEVKSADVPEVTDDDGTRVCVICGGLWGVSGPVDGIAADPSYLDVSVPPGKRKTLPVETTRTRSRMCSRDRVGSATPRGRWRSPPKGWAGPTPRRPRWPTTDRWCCPIVATRSPCRQGTRGSGSCSCPGSHSRSRWRGTARSCPHCYRDTLGLQRLGLTQVKAILARLPVRSANLGTGENGLHPEYLSIVEALQAAGIKVSLTSNGYSVARLPDVLLKGFHEIEFSFDHATPAGQDGFRGPGA